MGSSMIVGFADPELRAAAATALAESTGSLKLELPFPGNWPPRQAVITIDLLDSALQELWEAVTAAYERLAVDL